MTACNLVTEPCRHFGKRLRNRLRFQPRYSYTDGIRNVLKEAGRAVLQAALPKWEVRPWTSA